MGVVIRDSFLETYCKALISGVPGCPRLILQVHGVLSALNSTRPTLSGVTSGQPSSVLIQIRKSLCVIKRNLLRNKHDSILPSA